jgi:hypothetical protein
VNIAEFWNESWTSAVVNHLWQSTVVVAIAWLLTLALRKNHARVDAVIRADRYVGLVEGCLPS